jgi:hypothetical protein
MSEKSKSLLEQLQAVAGKAGESHGVTVAPDEGRSPSRQGKRAITIWVDPAVAEQLREIASHNRKAHQDLYLEALNILFSKYGRPEIA